MLDAPTSAHNVFVDPLFDDDMRDAGIEQTAVIAGQTLMLPSDNDIHNINLPEEVTLNYSHGIVINQDTHTKSMKINPYQNFEPIPVEVSLDPAVDRYSETIVHELRNALVDTHCWKVVPESRYSYRDYIAPALELTAPAIFRGLSLFLLIFPQGLNLLNLSAMLNQKALPISRALTRRLR